MSTLSTELKFLFLTFFYSLLIDLMCANQHEHLINVVVKHHQLLLSDHFLHVQISESDHFNDAGLS